jgi:hypothetical protein
MRSAAARVGLLLAVALATGCGTSPPGGTPDATVGGPDAPLPCSAPRPGCDYCGLDPNTDYGHCGGQWVYSCDPVRQQWVAAYCEPFGIYVRSDLRLALSAAGATGTCAATLPTDRTIHADHGAHPAITADPPMTVVDGSVDPDGLLVAHVHAELTDDWGTTGAAVPVAITYDLDLDWHGTLTGTAGATYGDVDPCGLELDVTGTWDVAW